MKEEFRAYLEQIAISTPVIERVETIVEDYLHICPEEVLTVFVSEYINDGGERVLESLWLFSEHYNMEAKNFVSTEVDAYDICSVVESMFRVDIRKTNFNLIDASADSRISVEFNWGTISGVMKASGKNCEFLWSAVNRHIKRHLE